MAVVGSIVGLPGIGVGTEVDGALDGAKLGGRDEGAAEVGAKDEGAAEGAKLGAFDEGAAEGAKLGGRDEGAAVGEKLGAFVGANEGDNVDGMAVVGTRVGLPGIGVGTEVDGALDGAKLGAFDEGAAEGAKLGAFVGGEADGAKVGLYYYFNNLILLKFGC